MVLYHVLFHIHSQLSAIQNYAPGWSNNIPGPHHIIPRCGVASKGEIHFWLVHLDVVIHINELRNNITLSVIDRLARRNRDHPGDLAAVGEARCISDCILLLC